MIIFKAMENTQIDYLNLDFNNLGDRAMIDAANFLL